MYDEELSTIEDKVKAAALDIQSKDNDKIRFSDVVAVFVTNWHKWIRATVKTKEHDGSFGVFALDYGIPLIVKPSLVVKLPNSFTGMQLKKKRIHIGGIENLHPAETTLDVDSGNAVLEKQSNWAPDAIALMQKLIDSAVKLNFHRVAVPEQLKKPHYFGRLMIQLENGKSINLVKCLLDMKMAVLVDNFNETIKDFESLHVNICTNTAGVVLDTKMCVKPRLTVTSSTGFSDDEFPEEEEINDDNANLSETDNEFFDESVSTFGMKRQNKFNGGKNKAKPQNAVQPVRKSVEADATTTTRNPSNASSSEHHSNPSSNTSQKSNQMKNATQKSNFNGNQRNKNLPKVYVAQNQNARAHDAERQRNQQPTFGITNRPNQPFNQQRGGYRDAPQNHTRGKGGYRPPNMRTSRQNKPFDSEFTSSFLRPIPESGPFQSQPNIPKNGLINYPPPTINQPPPHIGNSPHVGHPSHGQRRPNNVPNYPPPMMGLTNMYGGMSLQSANGPMNHPPFHFNHPNNFARFNKARNDTPNNMSRPTANSDQPQIMKRMEKKDPQANNSNIVTVKEEMELKPNSQEKSVPPKGSVDNTETSKDNSE